MTQRALLRDGHGVIAPRGHTGPPAQLATVAPFPFIVWGADEIRRLLIRRGRARHGLRRRL